MGFLYKKDGYADARDLDLTLLDLSLAKKVGRQVFAEIKSDEELKMLPVVILTTSSAERDILRSLQSCSQLLYNQTRRAGRVHEDRPSPTRLLVHRGQASYKDQEWALSY